MKAQLNSLDNLARCPVCDNFRSNIKTVVVKEEKNKATFHLYCGRCKTAALVFVSMNKLGIVSLGMLTDLAGSEARKFLGNEAVSVDSVIEVHEFLKNFKGGVKEFI